jgi:hypothetical protein
VLRSSCRGAYRSEVRAEDLYGGTVSMVLISLGTFALIVAVLDHANG